ncbi:serine/threonine-protein kinase [Plantactinospora sp. KBS50]|uniref:serine/threonine-protein kinase n=1 Tax=Plantactinospora sp. KBS50 TaxID=2024580 RepID=UPI001E5CFE70|nr:serine/threonine-protein kinase [Plantactinospora sp. KBS50]
MLGSGSILSGRYRLDERVATGGMGDVWRATDLVLGRTVAVKVLLPSLLSDSTFLARFRAEARMMASLRHPGIVQVFDSGEDRSADGGRADYLVMEYVEGEPLSRRVDATGGLSVAETLSVVEQAARALHGAHGAGIVHRDVKPSNLLVQPNGTVVLVDFGVARSTTVTSVTSTNAVPGTALYMAPEQASGKPVSPVTDVYALGAVAYCCLTGQPPFTGENPLEVAIKHLTDEPPPLPAHLPAPVVALVGRALAKAPEDRFPDAAAMADAARAAARGRSVGPAGAALAAPRSGATTRIGAASRTGTNGRPAATGPAAATVADGPVADGPATGVTVPRRRSRQRAMLGAGAAVLMGLVGLAGALALTTDDSDPAGRGGAGPAGATTTASDTQPGELVSDPSVPAETRYPGGGAQRSPSASPSAVPTAEPTAGPSSPAASPSAAASPSESAEEGPTGSPPSSPADGGESSNPTTGGAPQATP